MVALLEDQHLKVPGSSQGLVSASHDGDKDTGITCEVECDEQLSIIFPSLWPDLGVNKYGIAASG